MQVTDQAGWDNQVAINDDPYGAGVINFTIRWADLMEAAMANGLALEDIADRACNEADTDGITGFMYGCAVKELSHFWVHGEALRRWHNRKYLTPEKAQQADESGGVVNPAILVVGQP